jgi:hypothetical protein
LHRQHQSIFIVDDLILAARPSTGIVGEKSPLHSLTLYTVTANLSEQGLKCKDYLHQRARREKDGEAPSNNSAKTYKKVLAEFCPTQGESPIDTRRVVRHEPADCRKPDGNDQQNEMLEGIVHGSILHSRLA